MPTDRPRVAAVVVTHDSERWLPDLLASVEGQTHAPDDRLAVDDHSSDATLSLLEKNGWRVVRSTSSATDVTTRIAQNFAQGVRAAQDCDVAILGDHDDYWLPDRVEHQVGVLEEQSDSWIVASDGRIMNESKTLRDIFPVPTDWSSMTRAKRLRYALRHSISTGGASAVRPRPLLDPANKATPIPAGWLHDRWWSLAATAGDGIHLDRHAVIEYRVQDGQQIGLETGRQSRRVPRVQMSDVTRARDAARLFR